MPLMEEFYDPPVMDRPTRKATALRMVDAGYKKNAAASRVGVTPQTVSRWLRERRPLHEGTQECTDGTR